MPPAKRSLHGPRQPDTRCVRPAPNGEVTRKQFLSDRLSGCPRFPRFLYRETKTAGHGTGYDPTRPQKTWRTAWRALVKAAARRAGSEAAREAVQAGRGWRAARADWKRAAAPFRGLRFHDLRHCAITKLAESEASDQTIMSIAGHLDRSMLEHYSHIRVAARRKAVEAITSWVPPEEREAPAATKRVQ